MVIRKLVEIPLNHHQTMVNLREAYRNAGLRPPSIPVMVAFALDRGMPHLMKNFNAARRPKPARK